MVDIEKQNAVEVTPAALDWVEKQAVEGMKGRYATAEIIAKESATTLNLLIGAIGVSLAYVVRQVEMHNISWLVCAVGCLVVYLLVLGGVLLWKCMQIAPIPAIYNTPKNLDYGEGDWLLMRRRELRGIQIRIDDAYSRNERVATWHNRVRTGLVASPVVFILIAALAY